MTVTSSIKRTLKRVIPRKVIVKIRSMIDYIPSKTNNIGCKRNYNRLSKVAINKSCVKVGFLVQMPEIWDKQEPLFDAMVHDERFQPVLILVPPYDITNKRVGTSFDDNYFLQKYPEYCIKTLEDGKWIDVKELGLDYVFFQRPYNGYLPKELQSTTLSCHTRCCYIPYAFWPLKHALCGYNRPFYRSLYFGFLESKENCEEIIGLGDYEASRRYLFCGYPSLDKKKDFLQDNHGNLSTVLWTPRWNYDDNIGGSHFFEYKDKILTLKNEFEGISIVLRPHPLAFQNYVLTGKMSEEDVDNYKRSVIEAGCAFDLNEVIDETFKNIDILIADISSILYSFILHDKPIIFCNTQVPKSPSFESIMKGMYLANSWDDVLHWIREIRNGNDTLKSVRQRIAEEIRIVNSKAVDNIIGHLIDGK